MSSIKYNPNPPRVWSRVQNRCSTDTADSTVDYAKIDYDRQMLLKGNILQYKKNSSNLTKNQRYTQIAKGMWTNRTKTWATQSDTYTNPNNSSLLRVNYNILDPSNNTFSSRSNPFGCPTTEIQDGGNLVCNVVVNPCTQEVIKRSVSQQLCNPTTDSDVPGQIQQLCWNDGTQTWYPRQRYTMGNSGTSWPEGYKGFVSALTLEAPVLSLESSDNNSITLLWTAISNDCMPISSFNIYQNGILIGNVLYPIHTITISIICGYYTFYVTSLSSYIESVPSNIVSYSDIILAPTNLSLTYINPNSIYLSWDPVSNANLYKVYQTGEGVIDSTTSTNATIDIICGDYSFYVTACISGTDCESASSNPVSYTNTVSAPTNLTLTPNSSNPSTITLNWTASNNADSYKVYQTASYLQTTTTTNTATITGLTYNTTYSFYVIACISDTSCVSSPSNTTTPLYSFPMYTATGTYTNTTSGAYTYLTFTGNGSINFSGHTTDTQIICVGGGGGGAGGNYTSSSWWAGSGGGGGGIGSLVGSININQTYNITVGAKGNGGYGVNGNKGGDSSFGSLITSTGGGGGIFVENNSTALGGAAGNSSCSSSVFTSYTGGVGGDGGEIPSSGTSTIPSMSITTLGGLTYSFSGGGGGGSTNPSYYGGYAGKNGNGGALNYPYPYGENAITLGAGGGGASHYNEPYGGTQGGNGAPGCVVVIFLS